MKRPDSKQLHEVETSGDTKVKRPDDEQLHEIETNGDSKVKRPDSKQLHETETNGDPKVKSLPTHRTFSCTSGSRSQGPSPASQSSEAEALSSSDCSSETAEASASWICRKVPSDCVPPVFSEGRLVLRVSGGKPLRRASPALCSPNLSTATTLANGSLHKERADVMGVEGVCVCVCVWGGGGGGYIEAPPALCNPSLSTATIPACQQFTAHTTCRCYRTGK